MPKRKTRMPSFAPRALGLLAAAALGVFLVGETVRAVRSDTGRLALARTVGFGSRADLVRVVGRQLRQGLAAVGIPRDSVVETVLEGGTAAVRWRVGLRPGASLLQVNYALTRALEERGAVVLEAGERPSASGLATLRLLAGLPGRPTHEVLVVVAPGGRGPSATGPARVALVLYGFRDDAADADSFFAIPAPFAVAVVPGSKSGDRVLAHARDRHREIVIHLPLEPINYPSVNPGPGTVLVSMSPGRIAGTVRRHLERAGEVSAVANHMGSLATQDMTVMTAIYRELKRRRVAFLHMSPVPGEVCRSLAAEMGVHYAEPGAVVDHEARRDDPEALESRWAAVLEEARGHGRMVVMMRATPLTRRWLPQALAARRLGGVRIVPLATLLDRPGAL